MGMYDSVKLPHDNPVTGEREEYFQTKCGPRAFLRMTPKELIEYNKDDVDGVDFYDYYYDYSKGGNADVYEEKYIYFEEDKGWTHTITVDRGERYGKAYYELLADGKDPVADNPYKLEYLVDEWLDEKSLWSDKEEFMQRMSDEWDERHKADE